VSPELIGIPGYHLVSIFIVVVIVTFVSIDCRLVIPVACSRKRGYGSGVIVALEILNTSCSSYHFILLEKGVYPRCA